MNFNESLFENNGIEKIVHYFPKINHSQKEQITALEKLYNHWNSLINVISRKDITELYIHHVLHSLAIAKFVNFKPNTSVLDVGTGGGFPGIPLAIFFPNTNFTLIDAIGKKIKVVENISSELGLTNISARHINVKNINENYDFITARAVSRLKTLFKITKNKINSKSFNNVSNGLLLLKGGDLKNEILEVKVRKQIVNLENYFEQDYFKTKKLIYIPIN